MTTKPYCYAMVGQQFHYPVEGTLGVDIHIVAVPTGWLFAIEEGDKLNPYQLIPDKDHHLNPRSLIPASWQDDVDEDGDDYKPPEHQRMANYLWEFKADEVVTVPGVFTMTQQIKGQEFVPTAVRGDLIDFSDKSLNKKRTQGRVALDGFCRTITLHRYLSEEYDMEVDLEIGHRSDDTWQIRMDKFPGRPNTLIHPADIQQAHVMMLAMSFSRVAFQTIKCNLAENPDEHPFLMPDHN